MEHRSILKKGVAWTILVSMLNPAMVVSPAYALDTDIYTSVQTSSQSAQPNIVVILDTGDPMNVPEPWHEYQGPYDSHVEYLWNDATFLSNIALDLSVPFLWPTTEYGYWGGQSQAGSCANPVTGCVESMLPADRTALKTNALAYAVATPGATDPDTGDAAMIGATYASAGKREYWRNYGGGRSARNDTLQDARLIYWLPAGTAQTDFRLLAPSFNKWYGNLSRISGAAPRGGITWWALSSNVDQSPTAATNGQVAYNQCSDSMLGQVTPAMVSAGATVAATSIDTTATSAWNTFYSAFSTTYVPITVPMGLVPSTSYAPSNIPRNSGRYLGQPWQRWERYQGLINGRSTNGDTTYPNTLGATTFTNIIAAGSAVGTIGNSITARTEFLGGSSAVSYTPTPVRDSYNVAAPFGNGSTPGVWGLPIRTQGASPFSGWTNLKADFGGYLFGEMTTGAYYVNYTYVAALMALYQPLWNPAGTGVAAASGNLPWTALKGNRDDTGVTYDKMVGLEDYYDTAVSNLVLDTTTGAVICTRTCTVTASGGTVIAPAIDANAANHTGWWPSTSTCTNGGTAGTNCTTVPGACGAPAAGLAQYYTEIPTGCAWTGRQQVTVQGVGTYYYGGTCTGNCTGPNHVSGAAPCPAGQPVATNCTISGVTSPTVNGNVLTNAVLNSSTAGCGNAGNVSQTCAAREGQAGCLYNASCANTTVSSTAGTPVTYQVYPYAAQETLLYHECGADDPNNANLNTSTSPTGGNGGYPNKTARTWNTGWNNTDSAAVTAGYSNTATNSFASTAPLVDMYSVNYLNWMYGPKSNGNPIGRKTRLQIAKDALVTLVQTANNVRFSLINYNRTMSGTTPATDTDWGAHVAFTMQPMGAVYASTDPDYANRVNIIAAINNIVAGSRSPVTEALYEAYLYFSGGAPYGGLRTNAALVGGVENTGNDNAGAISGTAALCNAAAVSAGTCPAGSVGTKYQSPMMNNPNAPGVGTPVPGPAACQKNFVIDVTEGLAESDGYANATIQALRYPTTGSNASGNYFSPDTTNDSTQQPTNSHQIETSGQTALTLTSGVVVCQGVNHEPFCNGDQAGNYQDNSTQGGMYTSSVAPAPNNYIWFDELARFMSVGDAGPQWYFNTTAQPAITFTIAFGGQTSPVIQNAANVGGGQYFTANSSSSLANALQSVLAAIVAWNPSASSPTVPISAFNRTQSSTNVYLAFFGPTGLVNWPGTVKLFDLDTSASDCINDQGVTPQVCLVGQTALNGASKNITQTITDPTTGAQTIIVNPQAVSFWTPLTGSIPAPIGGTYPLHDGGNPSMGGTGFQLVENGQPWNRPLFTHLSTAPVAQALIVHNGNRIRTSNTNLVNSPALFGNASYSSTQVMTLINWIRGGDTTQAACSDGVADTGTGGCQPFRSWAHSAVIHSTPTVVTYNANVTPALQTLYYVSTDGILHAVDAQNTSTSTGGQERWAFMIEEGLPSINTLMSNNAGAQFSVADGTPVIFTNNVSQSGQIVIGTDKVYLFFGQRRGGQAYYALDITDPNNPYFLWKITPTSICSPTGCAASSSYAELGQTWSTPAAVALRAMPQGVPALIFGAGYDPNEDNVPVTNPDTMGRGVFIVRGDTGALLQGWTNANFPAMTYAIPSAPAALNMDNNAQGFVNRVYIGDMNANVFRFDINDANPANWVATQTASLNGGYARKIFFPPVVVKQYPFLNQRFDAVYTGTGDYEHPLITTGVSDKMFMIKDFNTGFVSTQSVPVLASALLDITNFNTTGCVAAGGNVSPACLTGAQDNQWLAAPGWLFDLSNSGEKVIGSPEVIGNVLDFGTYSPTLSLSACLPPGEGQLYGINAITGGLADTGLLPNGAVPPTSSRSYAGQGIEGRGFVTPGGIIVLNGQVYRVTVVDGALHTIPAGAMYQTRTYWQKEPQI